MKAVKIAIAVAALACGSDAFAAEGNSLELKCVGVVYENRGANQNKYEMDLALSVNLVSRKIVVEGPFFTKNHSITQVTATKYYIISDVEFSYNKENKIHDASGSISSWSSTLDRTNGYLIMIERDDYGNHAFNGVCSRVKTMF